MFHASAIDWFRRSDSLCPMVRFRVTVHQPVGASLVTCILVVSALFAPLLVHGQTVQGQFDDHADLAILQGSVRDSHGHPVAAVTVYLQAKAGTQTLTARTDAEGAYRFPGLREGVYLLRAEMAGYRDTTFGPCVLGQRETKKIDLTLESQKASGSSSDKPEFFDEPEFTVAGVTEAMNPGGHGSDAILQTTETLAKETASLPVTEPNRKAASSRTASVSSSSSAAAEESLRKQAEREAGNFDVNHRLGKLLLDDGKGAEAIPYLEQASRANPGDYENAFELALAYARDGQYERASEQTRTMLAAQDKAGKELDRQEQAELHHLLGDVEEKLGHSLEAVREYQHAAELNPSEANVFDWGTELLIHRAFQPAIEVFTEGNHLFPHSARTLTGLGVSWYARGSYDQAVQCLCQASDLNPNDPNPYLFLGKMQSVETTQSTCMMEKLGRFVSLQPENAQANYYYALGLSRRNDADDLAHAESLLEKAVRLDPKLAAAYLQLGILYSQRSDASKAISAYREAIEANPGLVPAHYRLAQAYIRNGEKSKAQAELQIYDQLSKKTAEEADRERREIQQFVYTLREPASASQPH
jgi:tetratricopeptide (TPR) repeat protein